MAIFTFLFNCKKSKFDFRQKISFQAAVGQENLDQYWLRFFLTKIGAKKELNAAKRNCNFFVVDRRRLRPAFSPICVKIKIKFFCVYRCFVRWILFPASRWVWNSSQVAVLLDLASVIRTLGGSLLLVLLPLMLLLLLSVLVLLLVSSSLLSLLVLLSLVSSKNIDGKLSASFLLRRTNRRFKSKPYFGWSIAVCRCLIGLSKLVTFWALGSAFELERKLSRLVLYASFQCKASTHYLGHCILFLRRCMLS